MLADREGAGRVELAPVSLKMGLVRPHFHTSAKTSLTAYIDLDEGVLRWQVVQTAPNYARRDIHVSASFGRVASSDLSIVPVVPHGPLLTLTVELLTAAPVNTHARDAYGDMNHKQERRVFGLRPAGTLRLLVGTFDLESTTPLVRALFRGEPAFASQPPSRRVSIAQPPTPTTPPPAAAAALAWARASFVEREHGAEPPEPERHSTRAIAPVLDCVEPAHAAAGSEHGACDGSASASAGSPVSRSTEAAGTPSTPDGSWRAPGAAWRCSAGGAYEPSSPSSPEPSPRLRFAPAFRGRPPPLDEDRELSLPSEPASPLLEPSAGGSGGDEVRGGGSWRAPPARLVRGGRSSASFASSVGSGAAGSGALGRAPPLHLTTLPRWVKLIPPQVYSPTLRRAIELSVTLWSAISIVWACWQLYRNLPLLHELLSPFVRLLYRYLEAVLSFLNRGLQSFTLLWLQYLRPLEVLLGPLSVVVEQAITAAVIATAGAMDAISALAAPAARVLAAVDVAARSAAATARALGVLLTQLFDGWRGSASTLLAAARPAMETAAATGKLVGTAIVLPLRHARAALIRARLIKPARYLLDQYHVSAEVQRLQAIKAFFTKNARKVVDGTQVLTSPSGALMRSPTLQQVMRKRTAGGALPSSASPAGARQKRGAADGATRRGLGSGGSSGLSRSLSPSSRATAGALAGARPRASRSNQPRALLGELELSDGIERSFSEGARVGPRAAASGLRRRTDDGIASDDELSHSQHSAASASTSTSSRARGGDVTFVDYSYSSLSDDFHESSDVLHHDVDDLAGWSNDADEQLCFVDAL